MGDSEIRNLEKMAAKQTKRRVVTTKEIAEALGYEQETIRNAAKSGKIPSIRLGRNFRFDPVAVGKALALSNTPTVPPK